MRLCTICIEKVKGSLLSHDRKLTYFQPEFIDSLMAHCSLCNIVLQLNSLLLVVLKTCIWVVLPWKIKSNYFGVITWDWNSVNVVTVPAFFLNLFLLRFLSKLNKNNQHFQKILDPVLSWSCGDGISAFLRTLRTFPR